MTKRVTQPLTHRQFERALRKAGKTSPRVTDALHEYLVMGASVASACRDYDVSPSTLYKRLKAMGLDVALLTSPREREAWKRRK